MTRWHKDSMNAAYLNVAIDAIAAENGWFGASVGRDSFP